MQLNVKPDLFSRVVSHIYKYLHGQRSIRSMRVTQAILLTLTIAIVTFSLIFPSFTNLEIDLRADGPWAVSRNAPEDMIAITNIEFLMEKQYRAAQEETALQTPLHLTRDFGVLEKRDAGGEKKQVSFQEMLKNDILNLRICRAAVKRRVDVSKCTYSKLQRWRSLNAEDWQALLRFSSTSLNERLRQIVNAVFENYAILKEEEKDPLFKNFKGTTVRVHDIRQGVAGEIDIPWENVISRKQLYSAPRVQANLKKLAQAVLKKSSVDQQRAFLKLSRAYLYRLDACRFDKRKTLDAQGKSRIQVARTNYIFQIKRGETIVRSGDVITENIYQALQTHQSEHWWEIVRLLISILVQQLIFLALMLYFVVRFAAKRLNDINSNLIIFSTLWIFALTLLFIENIWAADLKINEVSHFFGAWVPTAAFGILLALIFGERLSVPLVLYMSFLVFIASNYNGVSFFISITLGLSGLILGARIKKRLHFISITAVITGLSLLLVTIGYLYSNRSIWEGYGGSTLLTADYANALKTAGLAGLSTLSVLGILPVYETIFNIPTRFKLIELADHSHPLLRELFQRAPSTWTHTMMVAALTEKACEKLKLNAVLARTGIYFHDVGKMVNAGFFIENQHLIPKLENVDKNNPSAAARVIIAHVLDGIKMAQAARLPQEVIAFIPEHHGTSIMSFFYHKALQKNRRRVHKEDFQYKGPKPQSKETAIAMIADSVEAASRSMSVFTKESINTLIQKIISGKVAENQFDECDLTIGELNVIKESFQEVLISSFHSRPKYPSDGETRMLESRMAGKKVKNSKKISVASR